VLGFGIIENGRLMAIFGKDEGCVAIDHILGFLVETISWPKTHWC
jgi:hypothetical protein